jgi:hypothetical protein
MCAMEENLTPQESLQSDAESPEVADTAATADVADTAASEPSTPGRLRSLPWKTIGALTLTSAFGVTGVALLANADGRDHQRPAQVSINLPTAGQQGQLGGQGHLPQFGGRHDGDRHGRGFPGQPGQPSQQGQFGQQGGFAPGQPGQMPSSHSGGS